MDLAKEIWSKLSAIDVSKHTEKKGKFTYLSWAWAWAEFSKHYPNCDYKLSDRAFPDGTMEVGCQITVFAPETFSDPARNMSAPEPPKGRDVNRNMWLPVLNHQNKAIKNPSAFEVNTAKMRCLVKCLAMYGLGLYIYAGEDLPDIDYKETYSSSIDAIKSGIESGELSVAAEEWFTLPKHVQEGLWVATTKGGAFSTKEREVMKTPEFRQAYYGEDK